MSGDVDSLLAQVERAVEGRVPDEDVWGRDLNPARRDWLSGRSNNLPRLATACEAAVRPQKAADWWLSLLTEEWGAGGFWDAQEGGWSRNYAHATWLSEAAAMLIFRRNAAGNRPLHEALERSLLRRAAYAALCAVPRVVAHGARGQTIYQGMGVMGTGGRSNPIHHANHPSDGVAHRALYGERPPEERQPGATSRLADAVRSRGGFALTPEQRADLRRVFVSGGTDIDAVRRAVALLGPARTLAPVWTRRYLDGTLACGVDWNPSSNTSCTFLVVAPPRQVLPLDRDVVTWLHPYGGHARVRGGTALGKRILGRGETKWEDDGRVFYCSNLNLREWEDKDGERWVLRHRLPDPATVLWELRLGPDHAPRLTVGGSVETNPEPPTRPVDPVAPPTGPPSPPTSGCTHPPLPAHLPIGPKGAHVELIDHTTGNVAAVLNVHRDGHVDFLR